MSTLPVRVQGESGNHVDGWAGTEAIVPGPGLRPRYTRRSAHAWTTCSGTASNSRGFSCITYSFSMWYDSLTNFLKAASPPGTSWSSAEEMRKIWNFS